ncbi:hypothetical protein GLOTRDRAFT_134575 [Gloeophyllum trabeum ATCC 11539]|uniref:Uncharacterized protein n=1 Tax=Gloeophyllum trabeum (strain ATCC 11539 / FP-39264 / Madison 617) TaxID=670483 RepID=S7RBP4_GLOTA|nr:uncharacterized protein GLOTRDRAFT_134575 [Gloeophyllum trabeum ATCC 11539]EPQ49819.1 hypothetical protein GLOTRDRAFT_134575 [Gloeophyllum trabeum ATCC 11539]
MPVDGDPAAHVTSYQEAVSHLATTGFDIPAFVTAAILLSTLPSEPGDPDSWNQFVAGIKINKTTTLSTIVNAILEEKRCHTEPSVEVEQDEWVDEVEPEWGRGVSAGDGGNGISNGLVDMQL